jgi:hypothetical protein
MMTSNFDRQELLGIINALPDDRLIRALSAAGITIDGGSSMAADMALPDPVDELTPWNRTAVKVPLTTRPPMVNRSQTTDLPERAVAPGGYLGNPGMDNLAPYAATAAG